MERHGDAPGVLQLPEKVQTLPGAPHPFRIRHSPTVANPNKADAKKSDGAAAIVLQRREEVERLPVVACRRAEVGPAACQESKVTERVRLAPPVAAFPEDREGFP